MQILASLLTTAEFRIIPEVLLVPDLSVMSLSVWNA